MHVNNNSFPGTLVSGLQRNGPQALCKLVHFFGDVSFAVSIRNLILIAVDRFGAVVFPLRSPLITSKLCSFFIFVMWIFATDFNSPDVFTLELVEDPEGTWSVKRWKKVFEESLSFASFLLAHNILFTYIPVLLLVIFYLIILIILQMSIAIVTVFVLCWLPFSTNHLIIEYQDSSAHSRVVSQYIFM